MNAKPTALGAFEELVLLAILKLQDDAYGMKIRQTVADASDKDVSIGALYTTLDRLEDKGFVNSWEGDPTPERGGRAKRYFKVEAAGLKALREVHRSRGRILKDIDLEQLPVGEAI